MPMVSTMWSSVLSWRDQKQQPWWVLLMTFCKHLIVLAFAKMLRLCGSSNQWEECLESQYSL